MRVPLPTYHLPLTTYHLPLTTYHLPLTTYHLPLTTYHLPLTTYHLPLTTYHLVYHRPPHTATLFPLQFCGKSAMMKHEKFYGRGGAALPCANDEGDPVIMAFKYEITERIAVLSTNSSGWERQLNLISWNDHEPKYDIRDWSPDGSKMGKGISMTKEDLIALKGILDDMEL